MAQINRPRTASKSGDHTLFHFLLPFRRKNATRITYCLDYDNRLQFHVHLGFSTVLGAARAFAEDLVVASFMYSTVAHCKTADDTVFCRNVTLTVTRWRTLPPGNREIFHWVLLPSCKFGPHAHQPCLLYHHHHHHHHHFLFGYSETEVVSRSTG